MMSFVKKHWVLVLVGLWFFSRGSAAASTLTAGGGVGTNGGMLHDASIAFDPEPEARIPGGRLGR